MATTTFSDSTTKIVSAWLNDVNDAIYEGTLNVFNTNNTGDLGSAANALRTGYFATSVVTPTIDSGSTGALSLKTNNGSTQVVIVDQASVNFVTLFGSASLAGVQVGVASTSSDTNVDLLFHSKGTGAVTVRTNGGATNQFQVLHTASANRNITVTGSNGGNPTIDVTAGSLAITPAIVGAASITAHSGTAIPAGGTAGAGLMVSSTSNFGVFFGSGAPSLAAAKGSLYLRSDGSSTSTRAYINTDSGTTWTAITTAA